MDAGSDCIFCRILSGKAEASLVYRDGQVAAFMDIQPVNPGHVLVVPLRHSADLAGLDPADGERMFSLAMRVAAALRRTDLPCEGVNFYLADGRAAGQEVLHIHLHVVPRYSGDGFGLRRARRIERSSRAELDEISAQICGELDG
jgi:histidine triad (HIT) family protein